jgi:Ca2+-binding EF-hand superfamily protein
VAALLGGCGSSERPAPPATPVSPNGEPLVGAGADAACDSALAHWFDATDRDRDGSLTPQEFAADAQRWFATMDANGDGAVTPDELTQLRLKLMPPTVRAPTTERERYEEVRRERRGWFGDRPARSALDRPDPVMSADVNLDNRVTWDEFQAQAARTFVALDRNRDGRLSKDEVTATCAKR